jgi:hypothetical protein
VQLIRALHVEDADVRVLPDDAPQVAPSAVPLQLLCASFLVGAQFFDVFRVRIGRNVNVHSDVEQHDLAPGPSWRSTDTAPIGIALEKVQSVIVELNTKPGPRRHHQLEILVLQRLGDEFFG